MRLTILSWVGCDPINQLDDAKCHKFEPYSWVCYKSINNIYAFETIHIVSMLFLIRKHFGWWIIADPIRYVVAKAHRLYNQ